MRKFTPLCLIILFANQLGAQQKEGKVLYERTAQMQIRVNDNDAISQMLPKTRTDRFELAFGNSQSVWKDGDEDENNDEISGGGMQIRMVGPGQNDVLFYDHNTGKVIEQREMFDKKFIIEDSVRKLKWKITSETQTILDHVCQKATTQRIAMRMQMTMDNGKMERKEIADTSNITAWFTTDIPVSAGPEVPGQLPGLILALDVNNGRMVYKAIGISPKVDIASMANSLEVRCPFLDRELVEFSSRLPTDFKLSGTKGKRLVRAAFSDLLPPETFERRKHGFAVPLAQWFRGELRSEIQERLLDPASALAPVVCTAEVARLLDHDRLRTVAAGLPSRSREGLQVQSDLSMG